MTQEKDSKDKFSGLRSRAEETLSSMPADREDISSLSPEEIQRLVHELRVHQIELEMQNEDLRQAQIKLEALKDRYLDLYDFAPAGYVTLNEKGLIVEANLTAVRLLGEERQRLLKMPFSRFVCPEFGEAFYVHLKQVFETQSNQTCEIELPGKDGSKFYAQLESVAVQDESRQFNRCRTIVSDITDRKRTEEDLCNSETRLWDLYENAPNAYFSVGTDGLIRQCNKGAEELLGYPREMLEGKRVFDLYMDGQEGKEKAVKVFQKFISGERLTSEELQMQKADGSPIWISLSVNAIRDGDGKIVESRSTAVNITERKVAEEALRDSEEKFRNLFNNAEVGMFRTRPDGSEILDMNEKFLKIFGRTREEMRGSPSVIHWADSHEREEMVRRLNTDGRVTDFECKMLNKQGEVRVCLTSLRLYKEQGLLEGSILDITDRKKAEEALRISEEGYRALFQNSPVGIFRTTPEGKFIRANQAMARMLGYERAEELIHSIQNTAEDLWANPEDRQASIQELAMQSEPEAIEVKLKRRNGEHFYAEAILRIENDGEDNARHLEGTLQDITDRKRAEELALQAARLRSVSDLSSGVAHHFNNLLQIVMGSASLSLVDLESGDLSEVKTNQERMLEAATVGAEMVKRLQTFANMRVHVTGGEAAVFDVANTVRNAAEVSKPLWKSDPEKKGIKIHLQLDLKDGCLVKGQENEMFEVIVNLISNAAEAMPQGGDIGIKAFKEADEVVVRMRDTGIGIAEDDLPRVFQPFWSSKGVGIGKGMGLAVTHGLVKRHGGTISVQSNVGAGTTFTIRLPLTSEPLAKTEQPSMSTAWDRLTILVIDDDVNIASLLERICANGGHRVFKALSGQEGLAIFNKEPVDLVLCDLGMPEMNGWDVGKAIWSICRDREITKPPFILLTGWGGQELEKDKIAESGTDAVVAKPIDSATVLATVQEIGEQRGRGRVLDGGS
jgi:PAS domain S-box-containing protein